MDMPCSFASQHAAHERAEAEAEALDAHEAAEVERKRINFAAALRTGDKLGDQMFPTLADLVADFTGFGPTTAVDKFMAAAARALYAKAQAGDAEAKADIDALETYFLGR